MKKRLVDLRAGGAPILDIVSYGRGGIRSLTQPQIEQIARTVDRAPEVMVKVTGGARTIAGVHSHMSYIGREGDLGVESDMGERLQAKGFETAMSIDWNLDLEAHERQTERSILGLRKPPKLVHNIIFSMPEGTPPEKVLRAVRKLANDEFALKHRYGMALHSDEPHPHVHVVVKAMSEQGERLNIRKATLRSWRTQFAANLREQGVTANATERAVRGQTAIQKRTSIFRATQRGESTHMNARIRFVSADLTKRSVEPDPHKETLAETRRHVEHGWSVVNDLFERDGQMQTARDVPRFLAQMRTPQTEQEQIAELIRTRSAGSRDDRDNRFR